MKRRYRWKQPRPDPYEATPEMIESAREAMKSVVPLRLTLEDVFGARANAGFQFGSNGSSRATRKRGGRL